ncbi:glycosyltransferase [Stenotrophomonas sp. TWI587]|uniref:glycosyltransferase n=1 Tax=Stenotrophomonas sp. TWI587 TaxID=3136783 RepID=UPI0032085AF7
MQNPAVSVVMAEFNTDPLYLEESIESLVNQTFRDIEIIIVDDGGSTDLAGISARFSDPRIRILDSVGNRGLVYSLNRGIQSARGEYIVRMDTDDVATPNRIEKIHAFAVANPQFTVVGSLAVEFSDTHGTGRILGRPGEKIARNIMRGDAPIHPSVIFRRKDIIDSGLYDEFHRAEDLALWCKLVLAGRRIFVMNEVLLNYRVNPADYKKRTLKHRRGEIKARAFYYPKLGAGLHEYLFVIKPIIAGALPRKLVIAFRNRFILGQTKDPIP